MPPAKSVRNGHDDPKAETPNPKEKNGHHAGVHQSNGKLRRVASSTGSNLREVTSANAVTTPAPAAQTPAAATAICYLLGITAEGMECEDEAVGLVAVVVVRDTNNVFSLLAVDRHGVLATADSGCLTAAGRPSAQDRSDG